MFEKCLFKEIKIVENVGLFKNGCLKEVKHMW